MKSLRAWDTRFPSRYNLQVCLQLLLRSDRLLPDQFLPLISRLQQGSSTAAQRLGDWELLNWERGTHFASLTNNGTNGRFAARLQEEEGCV